MGHFQHSTPAGEGEGGGRTYNPNPDIFFRDSESCAYMLTNSMLDSNTKFSVTRLMGPYYTSVCVCAWVCRLGKKFSVLSIWKRVGAKVGPDQVGWLI